MIVVGKAEICSSNKAPKSPWFASAMGKASAQGRWQETCARGARLASGGSRSPRCWCGAQKAAGGLQSRCRSQRGSSAAVLAGGGTHNGSGWLARSTTPPQRRLGWPDGRAAAQGRSGGWRMAGAAGRRWQNSQQIGLRSASALEFQDEQPVERHGKRRAGGQAGRRAAGRALARPLLINGEIGDGWSPQVECECECKCRGCRQCTVVLWTVAPPAASAGDGSDNNKNNNARDTDRPVSRGPQQPCRVFDKQNHGRRRATGLCLGCP